jgi:hypothetical protein
MWYNVDMKNFERYKTSSPKDKRLGKRTVRVMEELSSKPGKSISGASANKSSAKASYRLLSNEKFESATVKAIHRAQTIERIKESGTKVVLISEDTTVINYDGLKSTSGLGPIYDNADSRGILVHSGLAVSEDGQPFGLLGQKVWTRNNEDYGKRVRRKQEPIETKESVKWLEVMEESEIREEGITTIHVCDRESDIYEFFAKAMSNGSNILCRKTFNRTLLGEAGELDAYMKQTNVSGSIVIELPRDSHSKQPSREAKLIVKHNKVKIKRPKNLTKNGNLPEYIELYSIVAEEEAPPENCSPVSWHLYTNMEITTFDETVKYIGYYTKRWLIERFHYVLKSGCKIEASQLKTVQALFNLECLYSIIAVEILYLTYLARTNPNGDCNELLDESEWKILYCVVNKTNILPESAPTILQAVILLARLGGFLNRKNDGFPGVKVLWQGISFFSVLIDAAPFIPYHLVGKV